MTPVFSEVMWKSNGMAHIVGSDDPHRVLCGANRYSGTNYKWNRWYPPQPDDHRCRKCVRILRERGGVLDGR